MDSTITRPLSVSEAAEQRVSIRKYKPEPIPRETLEHMLDLAGRAPSPWNLQPWRVIVVTDPELKAKLQDAAFGQPQVGAGAAVFAIYSDQLDALEKIEETIHPGMQGEARDKAREGILNHFATYTPENREQWGYALSYIFVGYLLLVAQSLGYGTSPMLGFDPEKVKSLLGLPDHARIPALISIGVPDEDGFPQFRRPVDRWASFR